MGKIINCKICGAEIASTAKVCPSCGAKNKPPVYKRVWFWLLIVFVVIPIISGVGRSGGTRDAGISGSSGDKESSSGNAVVAVKKSAFDGDCGITASGEMGASVIGYPELTVSISNTTEKEIAAIQFYAVPCDVYGDEITGWTSQNKLYTDRAIPAGRSDSITYQFIEDRVKTVKLYVYSVYFDDGSEWGDKEATKSTILNCGALIEVSGVS